MRRALLSLITSVLLTTTLATATTFYVSTTGDDANDGSIGSPCASIAYVYNNLALADDVIMVAAGTYNEIQMTGSKNITISGEAAGTTIIEGQSTPCIPESVTGRRLFQVNAATITLNDLTLRNYGFNNDNGGGCINLTNDGSNVYINRCNLTGNMARHGGAVQVNRGYCEIVDCYFSNNACAPNPAKASNANNYGSSSINGAGNGTLKLVNSVFYGNTRYDMPGTFMGTSVNAVAVTLQGNSTVVNNTFIMNTSSAIEVGIPAVNISAADTKTVIFKNNIVVSNKRDLYEDVDLQVGDASVLTDIGSNILGYLSMTDASVFSTNNELNPVFAVDYWQIRFDMTASVPTVYSTASGVNYVKATGGLVYHTGEYDVNVPEYDIAGVSRNTAAPTLGAAEVSIPNGSKNILEASFTTYTSGLTININNNFSESASVSIYNTAGQLVYSKASVNNVSHVTVNNKGLYFVQLTVNGQSHTKKVLVR